MNFEPLQLFPQNSEHDQGSTKRSSRAYSTSDDDKENAPSERRSTASIKLLHSSPVKSRTALNLIADPLPSHNIQASLPTPTKPLKEVQEVKSEPVSPSLENEARQDLHAMQGTEEMAGRSRRGKTVNYAEPSLRHKMRRTESLPGDKRRKSTYRRSSSTMLEDRRSSSSFSTAAQQAITIEED
ncbi:protein of unknown function [Taphrina deformans PYCC 5710]|uniref:Shugoshin C-terminal domain-containing protein n=1 Tax=Taphrina deformans (strain PYCC 5710 / ATCC 11124 / CBS 356.35 / IMI 108563 / JCM 9778 / NBRC 8474) TaxID=1097556 RepID=R4XK67_TAPDE|nr:protein of unknown function [Taphrina deformans PYCC 5710]|eukprot:CCG84844.1 protein of unknown function [Taphrina deformans PYCC 5710]